MRYLVGGLEPWNIMIFHSVGNGIIPTDSYFSEGLVETTNQQYTIPLFSHKLLI